MANQPYKYVSLIYSHLMRNIDYKEWSDYYLEIARRNKLRKPFTLELASGYGKMAGKLHKHIPEIILTDISKDMLMNAPRFFNTVCCNMTRLPFKKKFQYIICAFDSINYLLTKTAVNNLFNEVYNLLSEDGIFSFDVSLERNSLKNIKYLNKKAKIDGIKYIQKSVYNRGQGIHSNEFEISTPDGETYYEVHKQRIFPIEFYFDLLDKNNFYVRNCWDAFSFDDASKKSDRIQFVVLKDKTRC